MKRAISKPHSHRRMIIASSINEMGQALWQVN